MKKTRKIPVIEEKERVFNTKIASQENKSKILIIDSQFSTNRVPQTNLHWMNSYILSKELNADFIWSYNNVNKEIKKGYEKIIFVHTSKYDQVDKEWVRQSPDADLWYIKNDYNLGESMVLFNMCKEGRRYNVIANHPKDTSIILRKKYVNEWYVENLNSLSYNSGLYNLDSSKFVKTLRNGCIYYGSFRADRVKYFQKYLSDKTVILSTHKKNIGKFYDCCGIQTHSPRLNWKKKGLSPFKYSLYIEDERTHAGYSCLANRFYEAITYDVIPLFDRSCMNTIEKSGYPIEDKCVIDSTEDIKRIMDEDMQVDLTGLKKLAEIEKRTTLDNIKKLILGS